MPIQRARFFALSPTLQGMAWMIAAGLVFSLLNTVLRVVALQVNPLQVQFLRYFCGLLVMVPLILRVGVRAYRPNGLTGQMWRGLIHTTGMVLWYMALPHLTLADMTAIGFTSPIFVMIGAVLVFHERMFWERWASAALGFVGVLIVVGPRMQSTGGMYDLIMLASSPLFAASALITKALTRRDSPDVIIVWQCVTISLFSLPLALLDWTWPTAAQWGVFMGIAVLGNVAHYCTTRSLKAADATAGQTVKFLDLIWMTGLGYLVFRDLPTATTLAGGLVIFLATSWVARREARRRHSL